MILVPYIIYYRAINVYIPTNPMSACLACLQVVGSFSCMKEWAFLKHSRLLKKYFKEMSYIHYHSANNSAVAKSNISLLLPK